MIPFNILKDILTPSITLVTQMWSDSAVDFFRYVLIGNSHGINARAHPGGTQTLRVSREQMNYAGASEVRRIVPY